MRTLANFTFYGRQILSVLYLFSREQSASCDRRLFNFGSAKTAYQMLFNIIQRNRQHILGRIVPSNGESSVQLIAFSNLVSF